MKTTGIAIYRTDLPYVGGAYGWGAGNVITVARATIVVIETDAGINGCGEFTPCGENYMVANSEAAAAVAKLLAPALIGEDLRQKYRIERLMDHVLQGHGYAKAPFDAACWDILCKATGQPVWMLLGGKLTDSAPMYRVAPQKPTEDTVAERVPQTIMLDESMHRFQDHREAWQRGACEGMKVKPNWLGGLTCARQVRDFGVSVGWQMHIEDVGGTALADTAAIHLAASTPDANRPASWLCHYHLAVDPVSEQGAQNSGGVAVPPSAPGLGVAADETAIGAPVVTYE
jgi:L-alanine-DL-glutamate epimerase-like enolase superfamily enzyme